MRASVDRWGPAGALVAVAAIWGFTFVMVSDAIAAYPMYAFLAWRFGLATVAFAVFFPRCLKRLSPQNVKVGVIAGVLLAVGYIFQTWGLDGATRTTPARAAFITGLYVVLVPLAQALIMRRVPRKATIAGAVLAVAGLAFLSGLRSDGFTGWILGDSLVLVCAVAYSVHMLVLGSTDERHDTSALTVVQLAVVTVITAVISVLTENAGLPKEPQVIFAIVICGVFASALAFVIQTWAQRRMQPARVALILVTEPAFGGLFGWSVAGVWPIREVIGAVLMLGGMITSEAVAAFADSGGRGTFEPAVEGMPLVVEDETAIDPQEGAL